MNINFDIYFTACCVYREKAYRRAMKTDKTVSFIVARIPLHPQESDILNMKLMFNDEKLR